MTLRSLSNLVNDDVALVRRGRYLSTSFIVGIGEDDWLVTVENGKIADEDASAADGIQRLCDTGVEIRLGRFLETVSGAGVSRYFCDDEIRRDDHRRRPVSDDGESTVSQGYSGRTAGNS